MSSKITLIAFVVLLLAANLAVINSRPVKNSFRSVADQCIGTTDMWVTITPSASQVTLVGSAKISNHPNIPGVLFAQLTSIDPKYLNARRHRVLTVQDGVPVFQETHEYKRQLQTAIADAGDIVDGDQSVPPQAGALWYNQPIDLRTGFKTSFLLGIGPWLCPKISFSSTAHLTCAKKVWNPSKGQYTCLLEGLFLFGPPLLGVFSYCGGEGMAFVIQPNNPRQLGESGSGLGYKGIPNAFVIEFDTKANSANRDPVTRRHVSVIARRGPALASEVDALAWDDAPPNFNAPNPPDPDAPISNGQFYIEFLNGYLKVKVNDIPFVTYTETQLKLSSFFGLNSDDFYVGFTAGTGKTPQFHNITHWRIWIPTYDYRNSWVRLFVPRALPAAERPWYTMVGKVWKVDNYMQDVCGNKMEIKQADLKHYHVWMGVDCTEVARALNTEYTGETNAQTIWDMKCRWWGGHWFTWAFKGLAMGHLYVYIVPGPLDYLQLWFYLHARNYDAGLDPNNENIGYGSVDWSPAFLMTAHDWVDNRLNYINDYEVFPPNVDVVWPNPSSYNRGLLQYYRITPDCWRWYINSVQSGYYKVVSRFFKKSVTNGHYKVFIEVGHPWFVYSYAQMKETDDGNLATGISKTLYTAGTYLHVYFNLKDRVGNQLDASRKNSAKQWMTDVDNLQVFVQSFGYEANAGYQDFLKSAQRRGLWSIITHRAIRIGWHHFTPQIFGKTTACTYCYSIFIEPDVPVIGYTQVWPYDWNGGNYYAKDWMGIREIRAFRNYPLNLLIRLRDQFWNYCMQRQTNVADFDFYVTGYHMLPLKLCKYPYAHGGMVVYLCNDADKHTWSRLVFRDNYFLNVKQHSTNQWYNISNLAVMRQTQDFEYDADAANGPYNLVNTWFYDWYPIEHRFHWWCQNTWCVAQTWDSELVLRTNENYRFNDYLHGESTRIKIDVTPKDTSTQTGIFRWYWGMYHVTFLTYKSYDNETSPELRWRNVSLTIDGKALPKRVSKIVKPWLPSYGYVIEKSLVKGTENRIPTQSVDNFLEFSYVLYDPWMNPTACWPFYAQDILLYNVENGVWIATKPDPATDYTKTNYNQYNVKTKRTLATLYYVQSQFFKNFAWWLHVVRGDASYAKNQYVVEMIPGVFRPQNSWSRIDMSRGDVSQGRLIAGKKLHFFMYIRDQYNNYIPGERHYRNDSVAQLSVNFKPSESLRVAGEASSKTFDNSTVELTAGSFKYLYFNTQLIRVGLSTFYPKLNGTAISCQICSIPVDFAPSDWSLSDLYIVKDTKEIFMVDLAKGVEIENTKEYPVFYLRFKDGFHNLFPSIPPGWTDFYGNVTFQDKAFKFPLVGEIYRSGIRFVLPPIYSYVDAKGDSSDERNSYTNLPYGVYIINLKGTNPQGVIQYFSINTTFMGEGKEADAIYSGGAINATTSNVSKVEVVAGKIATASFIFRTSEVKDAISNTYGIAKFSFRDIKNKGVRLIPTAGSQEMYEVALMNDKAKGFALASFVLTKAGLHNYTVQVNVNYQSQLNPIWVNLTTLLQVLVKPGPYRFFTVSDLLDTAHFNKVTIDDPAEAVIHPRDAFGNIAHEDVTEQSFALKITPNEGNQNPAPKSSLSFDNKTKTWRVKISSDYTGNYSLFGSAMREHRQIEIPRVAYFVVFYPGRPYAPNCVISLNTTETNAGEAIRVSVTPYDKMKNYISLDAQASIYDTRDVLKTTDLFIKYINSTDQVLGDNTTTTPVFDGEKMFFELNPAIAGNTEFNVIMNGSKIPAQQNIIKINPLAPEQGKMKIGVLDSVLLASQKEVYRYYGVKDRAVFSTEFFIKIKVAALDKYENDVGKLPAEFDSAYAYLEMKTEFKATDVEQFPLCQSADDRTVFELCNDKLIKRKWKFLLTNDYLVTMKFSASTSSKTIDTSIQLQLVSKSDDKDASNLPLSWDNSIIVDAATKLVTQAGDSTEFEFEMRTIKNVDGTTKRKNYWFDESEGINNLFRLEFSQGANSIKYSYQEGSKFGRYLFKLRTTLSSGSGTIVISLFANNTKISQTKGWQVRPKCDKNGVYDLSLVKYVQYRNSLGQAISRLPKSHVDIAYVVYFSVHDEFYNQCQVNEKNVASLASIGLTRSKVPIDHKIKTSGWGLIIVTYQPTIIGTYIINVNGNAKGAEFTHGIAVRKTSAAAGVWKTDVNVNRANDEFAVEITAKDQYGNIVTITPQLIKLFNVYFRVKGDTVWTPFQVAAGSPCIASTSSFGVFTCKQKDVTLAAQYEMKVTLKDEDVDLTRGVFEMKHHLSLDYTNSAFQYQDFPYANSAASEWLNFPTAAGVFLQESKEQTPNYRHVLRDIYGNPYLDKPTETFTCVAILHPTGSTKFPGKAFNVAQIDFNAQVLTPYVFFSLESENLDVWEKSLATGTLLLKCFADTKQKNYNIAVVSKGQPTDFADIELDNSKIVIDSADGASKEFLRNIVTTIRAGETAAFVVEYRSINDIRKINLAKNTTATIEGTPEGVVVTNVYNSSIIGRVIVVLNGTRVRKEPYNVQVFYGADKIVVLDIKLYVVPGDLVSVNITSPINTQRAGTEYKLNISSWDRFGNHPAITKQQIALRITEPEPFILQGKTKNSTEGQVSSTEGTMKVQIAGGQDGFIIVTMYPYIAGVYAVNSSYFLDRTGYDINIIPDFPDLESSYIALDRTQIRAGELINVFIMVVDQYNNIYNPSTLNHSEFVVQQSINDGDRVNLTDFVVTNNTDFPVFQFTNRKLINITVTGQTDFYFYFINADGNLGGIRAFNQTVNVKHDALFLPNSRFLTKDNTEVKTAEKFTVEDGNLLDTNLIFYDRYMNQIPALNESESFSASVRGNNMETITLEVTQAINDTKVQLSIKTEDEFEFKRLVPAQNYEIVLVYNLDGQSKGNFSLFFNINGVDQGYGNGKLSVQDIVISPIDFSIIAGTSKILTITLRNSEKKKYFPEESFDETKDIVLIPSNANLTFSDIQKKAPNTAESEFTLTSKIATYEWFYTLRVNVTYRNQTLQLVQAVRVYVQPDRAVKDKTVFIKTPVADYYVGVTPIQTISFKLYDQFDNQVRHTEYHNYLKLTAIGVSLSSVNFTSFGNYTYGVQFALSYPPRTNRLQLTYKNGSEIVTLTDEFVVTVHNVHDQNNNFLIDLKGMRADQSLSFITLVKDKDNYCYEDSLDVALTVDGPYENDDIFNSKQVSVQNYTNQSLTISKAEYEAAKNAVDGQCRYYWTAALGQALLNKTGYYQLNMAINGTPAGIVWSGNSYQKSARFYVDYASISGINSKFYRIGQAAAGQIHKIRAGEQFTLYLVAHDRFNNLFNTTVIEGDLTIEKLGKLETKDYTYSIEKEGVGQFRITATVTMVTTIENILFRFTSEGKTQDFNYNTATLEFNGRFAPVSIEVTQQPCSDVHPSVDTTSFSSNKVEVGQFNTIILTCFDQFNNRVQTGENDKFTYASKCQYNIGPDSLPVKLNIAANDGRYTYSFVAAHQGICNIQFYLDGREYGKQIDIEVFYKMPTITSNSKESEQSTVSAKSSSLSDWKCQKSDSLDVLIACRTEDFKKGGEKECVSLRNNCSSFESQIKCQDGSFAHSQCSTNPKIQCAAPFVSCKTGECVSDLNKCPTPLACPIGYYFCDDQRCVADVDQCTTLQKCDSSKGAIFRCWEGSCATCPSNCPSRVVCPINKNVVCPDGKCYKSEIECPAIVECQNNQVRCRNGQCVEDLTSCSSGRTCKEGLVLCDDGNCQDTCVEQTSAGGFRRRLQSSTTSTTTVTSTNKTEIKMMYCPSGEQVPNLYLCPTPQSCPRGQVSCQDGSCMDDVRMCPVKVCQSDERLCWNGQCIKKDKPELCPTRSACPFTLPVKCHDGRCTKTAEQCPEYIPCPAETSFRCASGECRKSSLECPSSTICPTEAPIQCNDGQCVKAPYHCYDIAIKKTCESNKVLCADGSCAISKALCPTQITCGIDMIRCSDGQCVNDLEKCKSIPADRIMCPADLPLKCQDGSCRKSYTDCPTPMICPSDKPILCDDGNCRESKTQCAVDTSCPSNQLRCPDGTCTDSLCDTQITCSKYAQFKCWDNTCKQDPRDCPDMPACTASAPILCPEGKCVPARQFCARVNAEVCDFKKPIRCPDMRCFASAEECLPIDGCPSGFFQCKTGECVKQSDSCQKQQCPLHLPNRCDNGFCVAEERFCDNSENGCPWNKPFKCGNGRCVADQQVCESNKAKCDTTQTACDDGSCVPKGFQCMNVFGCPAKEERKCVDGQCKPKSERCSIGSCPRESPVQCMNGLCVKSTSQCPLTVSTNELMSCSNEAEGNNFPCADGTCVASPDQCKPLIPCLINQFRCNDGSCRSLKDLCPTVDSVCPPNRKQRCHSGACATRNETCPSSNGCPYFAMHKCEDSGECVVKSDDCDDIITTNGCPIAKPHKCQDGQCVANPSTQCNDKACPTDRPFKCLDGTCSSTLQECILKGFGCNNKTVVCPNGKCADNYESCKTTNECPIDTPFRCADGSCSAEPSTIEGQKGCKATVKCHPHKPFLCANGECVGDSRLCHVQEVCPPEASFRCADKTCVSNQSKCSNITSCPLTSPIMCEIGGHCVKSVTECISTQECTESEPIKCATGLCAETPEMCILSTVYVSRLLQSGSLEADHGCSIDRPNRCSDGSCRIATDSCPIFQGCNSIEKPFLCKSGKCASNKLECSADKDLKTCTISGHSRCDDGICRRSCKALKSNSCPQTLPWRCPSGLCSKSLSQCSGESDCPLNTPFRCKNGQCVASNSQCRRVQITAFQTETFATTVNPAQSVDLAFIHEGDSLVKLANLKIPASALLSPIQSLKDRKSFGDVVVKIQPVAESEVLDFTNEFSRPEVDAELAKIIFPLSQGNLKFHQTVRSPIIKISTIGRHADEEYRSGLVFDIAVEELVHEYYNAFEHLCLARANFETKKWECASRKLINTTTVNNITKARFTVSKDGAYAVIFNPRPPVKAVQVINCGFICQNKVTLLILTCGVMPALIIVAYIFWRMFRYMQKYRATKKQQAIYMDAIKQISNTTSDIVGATFRDKIEGITFTMNPLIKQDREKLSKIEELRSIIEKLDKDRKSIDRENNELVEKNKWFSKESENLRSEIEKKKTQGHQYNLEKVEVQREFE